MCKQGSAGMGPAEAEEARLWEEVRLRGDGRRQDASQ